MCVRLFVCVHACYSVMSVCDSGWERLETEDIIYSLSGRAIVCQEGLYCPLCQNNRIERDIPMAVCACVCLSVWQLIVLHFMQPRK